MCAKQKTKKLNTGAFDFVTHWNNVLPNYPTKDVEILATLTEDGINSFLAEHFQLNPGSYSYTVTKDYVLDGVTLQFGAQISATAPISIELAPLATNSDGGKMASGAGVWNNVGSGNSAAFSQDPHAIHHHGDPLTANVRVNCPAVNFLLHWPQVDDQGNILPPPNPPYPGGLPFPPWCFSLSFAIVAEGVISFSQIPLPDPDAGTYITVAPLRVKFTPVNIPPASQLLDVLKANVQIPQKLASAVDDSDRKFRDLLDIILNIVGYEYAPRIVENIKLPTPALAGINILPSFLDISNKAVTLGAGTDAQSVQRQAQAQLNNAFVTYRSLLSQDVEAAGGLEAISRKINKTGKRKPFRSLSPKDRAKLLPRATAYVETLLTARKGNAKARRPFSADIPNAFGVAVNQHLLTQLANIPFPVNQRGRENTPTLGVVPPVRGFIEYWINLGNASVTISGTTVEGSVQVDVGGGIGASVWDVAKCPPAWEDVAEITLAFVGRPAVTLALSPGTGIVLNAQKVDLSQCAIETNLPFPFGDIVSAIGGLIINDLAAIITVAAGFIKFNVVPPSISLTGQNVILSFSDFTPLPYVRQQAPAGGPQIDPDRLPFIGYEGGISLTKITSNFAVLKETVRLRRHVGRR